MATPINDYTDAVDYRAGHVNRFSKNFILDLIDKEMKKPYGDYQIGAMMALLNLKIIIEES